MDDESEVLGIWNQADVEVRAVGIKAGHSGQSVVVVAGIFCGIFKGIDSPVRVVSVGPKVVNASISRQQRGRIGQTRLALIQLADAGDSPSIQTLRSRDRQTRSDRDLSGRHPTPRDCG